MGKKNWIEFDNQEKKSEEKAKIDTFNKKSKLKTYPNPCFINYEIPLYEETQLISIPYHPVTGYYYQLMFPQYHKKL